MAIWNWSLVIKSAKAVKYPHTHLWINNRNVSLKDVCESRALPRTEFESNTFSFIREWLSGQEHFEIFTSGSTGNPKAINITRQQMVTSALLTASALGLADGFNALVCLDTKYIAGRMMLVRCFEIGMKIFALDPCANPLHKIPVDKTIHFAALVPYQIKAVLESKHPHLLDTLLICIIGGAALDELTVEKLHNFSGKFYVTYGMTETVSHIALRAVNGSEASPYFTTLSGISIETDERACLTIAAPFLGEKIVTNDVVEVIDEKHFKWKGRWDNVINSGGVKILPEKIEERIGQIFTRLQIDGGFFVHGVADAKLGQRLVLVMENVPAADKLKMLKQQLIHSFPPYEIPKELYGASSFIYTATRKINRTESFQTSYFIERIKD